MTERQKERRKDRKTKQQKISRFFDLLSSIIYDLKRSVDLRWLFDPVFHSFLGDLFYIIFSWQVFIKVRWIWKKLIGDKAWLPLCLEKNVTRNKTQVRRGFCYRFAIFFSVAKLLINIIWAGLYLSQWCVRSQLQKVLLKGGGIVCTQGVPEMLALVWW